MIHFNHNVKYRYAAKRGMEDILMDRYEFISTLRASLTGKVPSTTVEDNVQYYEEYIEIQLRQGKSEEEILGALGDPRLLAKTVIEANKYAEGTDTYGGDDYGEVPVGGSGKSFWEWYRERPSWLHTIMSVLITALVLFVVFTVLQALFPLILMAVLVMGIYRLIRQHRSY